MVRFELAYFPYTAADCCSNCTAAEAEYQLIYMVEPYVKQTLEDNFIRGILGKIYVCHLQTVDCAIIYAIAEQDPGHLSNGAFLKMLQNGDFKIGVKRLNDINDISDEDEKSYHIIYDITSYMAEENSELRLHYTQPRSYPGNIAWRSIHWDLLAELVNKE